MATQGKNPDWHVWAGDALYWLRTPPGIYIFIIVILGLGLAIQSNGPKLPPTYPTPTFYTQAPTIQPQRIVSTQPPPIMKTDNCPDGSIYVQHLSGCIPGHHRTTTFFVEGTKNNCPDDAIFSDRVGRCIPMYDAGNYTMNSPGTSLVSQAAATPSCTSAPARFAFIAPTSISIESSAQAPAPSS